MSDHDAVQCGIENVFSTAGMLATQAVNILEATYNRPSAVYGTDILDAAENRDVI